MAITKIQSESLNLADDFAFTGTITGAGGVNTPAFEAYATATQSISQDTQTKLTFNTENFDVGNSYDNSTNFRFQPQTSGKYFVYARATTDPSAYNNERDSDLKFYKNGSPITEYFSNIMVGNLSTPEGATASTHNLEGTITLNGSSDYIEVYGRMFNHSGTGASFVKKLFGAFKIIE